MKRSLLFSVSFLVFLLSCGPSTKITKSWRDPGFTVDMSKMNKVLIAALMKDETTRRQVEETMVQRMKGKGVASYSYITPELQKAGENEITAKLKQDGFDGAVVIRFLDTEKETSYVPGTATYPAYYGRWGGYYGSAWGAYSTPGYYQQDKIYHIETNVYTLPGDKLVWSGVTATTNPSKMDKMINEIAQVIHDKMVAEKFLVN